MGKYVKNGSWLALAGVFIIPLAWLILGTAAGSMRGYAEGYYFMGVWYYDYQAVLAYISAVFISYWWMLLICIAGLIFSFAKEGEISEEREKMTDEEYLDASLREIANMDENELL